MPDDHHRMEAPPYRTAPQGDTLGVIHVEEALRDLPFPATREEILARAGNWRMPITGAHYHRLSEMMENVPNGARFRSAKDVARAIAKADPNLRP